MTHEVLAFGLPPVAIADFSIGLALSSSGDCAAKLEFHEILANHYTEWHCTEQGINHAQTIAESKHLL